MSTPFSAAVLWPQFTLAAALHRVGLVHKDKGGVNGEVTEAFCYVDTHAGGGQITPPYPHLARFKDRRHSFTHTSFADALDSLPPERGYPGSWVLAAQVLMGLDMDFDIDINDLSSEALDQARQNQQIARIRYWSHDWFKFLRTRLSMAHPPNFVFIDPPHHEDGTAYILDAALLLDTIRVPYMATYSSIPRQEVIDTIGRSGLELHWGGKHCCGILLGGGAERIVLPLLPDLRFLANCLEGQFHIRTPHNDDFTI